MVLKKKKKTPSQIKRNQERMKSFLEKKREASGILEDEAEYELKVEAHARCTKEDIVEAVETNFWGALDDAKIEADDSMRNIKIKKSEKLQIKRIKGEFRNLQVFNIVIKDKDEARNIIGDWKDTFDDYAFKNTDCAEIRINIREIERIR